MTDVEPQLDARAMLAELYPPPNELTVSWPAPRDGYLAIPSPGAARLLLPADRAVAPESLRHARRPLSLGSRIQTTLARVALRSGAAQAVGGGFAVRRVAGADSIETYLESVLGRPIVTGIFLGPRRANRKPVLQILDPTGSLLAVAKVGMNPLTRRLAANESTALRRLGTRATTVLTTPGLLHFGEWRDHTVLVQSALDLVGARVEIDSRIRETAMGELAEFHGSRSEPWAASGYLKRLGVRVKGLDDSALVRRLGDAVDLLAQSERRVRLGTWHGDWTAWNMAVRDGRALVWDWERYEENVPVGFDGLHYAFMPALKAAAGRENAAVQLIANAQETLRPFGIVGQDARIVSFCYILDLATRYLQDRQAETGVGGGFVAQWLEPVLRAVRDRGISGMDDWRG